MSNFSKNTSNSASKAYFKKHHVYEVAENLADSKHIADDYSNAHKYQHRASVLIVGAAGLRPYDPIYLDGLPNGLSGYWTVLSIKHVFGGKPAKYMVRLEVGTDVIGDVDPKAKYRSNTRDVQSDLSNQSLTPSESRLNEYSLSVNSQSISPAYGGTSTTSANASSSVTVPPVPGTTPYSYSSPNLQSVKKTVTWSAKSSGRVIK
jgi:hypothetical protein